MNDSLNKSKIAGHEGERLVAYPDSRGFLTVGRGFNLDAPGASRICAQAGVLFAAVCAGNPITQAQSEAIFDQQYAWVANEARNIFPGIDTYPDAAAAVICDMLFELGLAGFLAFHNTIEALKARNWAAAIAGIQDSKLESEVPGRVEDNVAMLYALQNETVA